MFNKLTRTHLIIIGVVGVLATTIVIGTVIIKTRSSKPSNSGKIRVPSVISQWKRFNSDAQNSLENAFVGGTNSDGGPIYVCRVNSTETRELLPGTYDPVRGNCEMTYNGKAYALTKFDLLMTSDPSSFIWVPKSRGEIPSGSIIAGLSLERDEMPIARALVSGGQLIGKVHRRHRKAYVPFAGRESEITDYQVLCVQEYNL